MIVTSDPVEGDRLAGRTRSVPAGLSARRCRATVTTRWPGWPTSVARAARWRWCSPISPSARRTASRCWPGCGARPAPPAVCCCWSGAPRRPDAGRVTSPRSRGRRHGAHQADRSSRRGVPHGDHRGPRRVVVDDGARSSRRSRSSTRTMGAAGRSTRCSIASASPAASTTPTPPSRSSDRRPRAARGVAHARRGDGHDGPHRPHEP